ncbi:MAG: hypothetical protein U5K27_02465 [Desulfotignum sp.]|nr:hypothetical protein [Desulfotignum sp.]
MPLIEALYLKSKFLEKFSGKAKNDILETADKTDRALVKLKREAYKKVKAGADQLEIVGRMSQSGCAALCWDLMTCACCMNFGPSPAAFTGYPPPRPVPAISAGVPDFIQGTAYLHTEHGQALYPAPAFISPAHQGHQFQQYQNA